MTQSMELPVDDVAISSMLVGYLCCLSSPS